MSNPIDDPVKTDEHPTADPDIKAKQEDKAPQRKPTTPSNPNSEGVEQVTNEADHESEERTTEEKKEPGQEREEQAQESKENVTTDDETVEQIEEDDNPGSTSDTGSNDQQSEHGLHQDQEETNSDQTNESMNQEPKNWHKEAMDALKDAKKSDQVFVDLIPVETADIKLTQAVFEEPPDYRKKKAQILTIRKNLIMVYGDPEVGKRTTAIKIIIDKFLKGKADPSKSLEESLEELEIFAIRARSVHNFYDYINEEKIRRGAYYIVDFSHLTNRLSDYKLMVDFSNSFNQRFVDMEAVLIILTEESPDTLKKLSMPYISACNADVKNIFQNHLDYFKNGVSGNKLRTPISELIKNRQDEIIKSLRKPFQVRRFFEIVHLTATANSNFTFLQECLKAIEKMNRNETKTWFRELEDSQKVIAFLILLGPIKQTTLMEIFHNHFNLNRLDTQTTFFNKNYFNSEEVFERLNCTIDESQKIYFKDDDYKYEMWSQLTKNLELGKLMILSFINNLRIFKEGDHKICVGLGLFIGTVGSFQLQDTEEQFNQIIENFKDQLRYKSLLIVSTALVHIIENNTNRIRWAIGLIRRWVESKDGNKILMAVYCASQIYRFTSYLSMLPNQEQYRLNTAKEDCLNEIQKVIFYPYNVKGSDILDFLISSMDNKKASFGAMSIILEVDSVAIVNRFKIWLTEETLVDLVTSCIYYHLSMEIFKANSLSKQNLSPIISLISSFTANNDKHKNGLNSFFKILEYWLKDEIWYNEIRSTLMTFLGKARSHSIFAIIEACIKNWIGSQNHLARALGSEMIGIGYYLLGNPNYANIATIYILSENTPNANIVTNNVKNILINQFNTSVYNKGSISTSGPQPIPNVYAHPQLWMPVLEKVEANAGDLFLGIFEESICDLEDLPATDWFNKSILVTTQRKASLPQGIKGRSIEVRQHQKASHSQKSIRNILERIHDLSLQSITASSGRHLKLGKFIVDKSIVDKVPFDKDSFELHNLQRLGLFIIVTFYQDPKAAIASVRQFMAEESFFSIAHSKALGTLILRLAAHQNPNSLPHNEFGCMVKEIIQLGDWTYTTFCFNTWRTWFDTYPEWEGLATTPKTQFNNHWSKMLDSAAKNPPDNLNQALNYWKGTNLNQQVLEEIKWRFQLHGEPKHIETSFGVLILPSSLARSNTPYKYRWLWDWIDKLNHHFGRTEIVPFVMGHRASAANVDLLFEESGEKVQPNLIFSTVETDICKNAAFILVVKHEPIFDLEDCQQIDRPNRLIELCIGEKTRPTGWLNSFSGQKDAAHLIECLRDMLVRASSEKLKKNRPTAQAMDDAKKSIQQQKGAHRG